MAEKTVKELEIELTHLRDDMYTLRGKLLREVRRSLELLSIAQQALEVGKTAVVFDHVERAVEGLRKQEELLVKEQRA